MTVTVVAIGLGHVAVAVADIDGILGPKGGSPGAILRAIALHLPRTTRSPLQEGGMGEGEGENGTETASKSGGAYVGTRRNTIRTGTGSHYTLHLSLSLSLAHTRCGQVGIRRGR